MKNGYSFNTVWKANKQYRSPTNLFPKKLYKIIRLTQWIYGCWKNKSLVATINKGYVFSCHPISKKKKRGGALRYYTPEGQRGRDLAISSNVV